MLRLTTAAGLLLLGGCITSEAPDFETTPADQALSDEDCRPEPELSDKVLVCHQTGNGEHHIIDISWNALDAHLDNHGDWLVSSESCDGVDNDCDGTVDEDLGSVWLESAEPVDSCAGQDNLAVHFDICGCPELTLSGAFVDATDGSGGQVEAVAATGDGWTMVWDDAEAGGDCDLDIAVDTRWSWERVDDELWLTVSQEATAYEAAHEVLAGFELTDQGTWLVGRDEAMSESFSWTCSD